MVLGASTLGPYCLDLAAITFINVASCHCFRVSCSGVRVCPLQAHGKNYQLTYIFGDRVIEDNYGSFC